MLSPNKTRKKGCCLDCSIASIARCAEIKAAVAEFKQGYRPAATDAVSQPKPAQK